MNHRILIGVLQAITAASLLLMSGNAAALLPFEKTGNLYVSMWVADEIAVFQPDGTEAERFTTPGLDGPRGIAFNPANGEIWIASEFGNAIFIFDHQHEFLRTLEHEDFNEPVGVTFAMTEGVDAASQEVYISNSNGNEIMVFDQSGNLLRRFSDISLSDPNCSAFMQDGSLFVANRLGGTQGSLGAVSKFSADDEFLFDFTAPGIASLMAVARDPNVMPVGLDDTVWATSGGGDTGIYEFDQNGNLLTTLLPGDIDDGRRIVPQGIAFDSDGNFVVVSFLNEVIKFDGDGNFMMRFPTGEGTARSTAFQGCQPQSGAAGECVPFGALGSEAGSETTTDADATVDTPDGEFSGVEVSNLENASGVVGSSSGGGGGAFGFSMIWLAPLLCLRIRKNKVFTDTTELIDSITRRQL